MILYRYCCLIFNKEIISIKYFNFLLIIFILICNYLVFSLIYFKDFSILKLNSYKLSAYKALTSPIYDQHYFVPGTKTNNKGFKYKKENCFSRALTLNVCYSSSYSFRYKILLKIKSIKLIN